MSSFLHALQQKNHSSPPIWLMRQAGRFLPQYRALKKDHALLDLFRNPEMIVPITLLPIDILQVDAAILFSDILTVLDGLGQGYHFEEKKGPIIHNPIKNHLPLQRSSDCYTHISQAITELKKQLKVPLIGFAGAPFTVASYLIEEARSPHLHDTKKLYYSNPTEFLAILDRITDATIDYLEIQIKAGVDAIQLFDSWANALPLHDFRICTLAPIKKIALALKKYQIPLIVFCRGSSFFATELATLPIEAISIDFSGELSMIRQQVKTKALQGNLDPMALYGSKDEIKRACDRILESMQGDPGFIFNLGHGILPDSDLNKVQFMVDYVKNRSSSTARVA